jgi:hypothetical protein
VLANHTSNYIKGVINEPLKLWSDSCFLTSEGLFLAATAPPDSTGFSSCPARAVTDTLTGAALETSTRWEKIVPNANDRM